MTEPRWPAGARVAADTPLGPLTTLGVGGPAQWLVDVHDAPTAIATLERAAAGGVPWRVLGGGSNVVIADAGLPGATLRLSGALAAIELSRRPAAGGAGETVEVRAGGGASWDTLVQRTTDAGLGALACLSGIPGSVGAAPIQNIGAYGAELAETFVAATVATAAPDGVVVERWDAERMAFGYRDSALRRGPPGRHLVLDVTLRLPTAREVAIRYGELARRLGDASGSPAATRAAVVEIRRSKGMVVDAADPDSRSCGSFFTNPIVPLAVADRAEQRLAPSLAAGQTMPRFAAPATTAGAAEPRVKLSAAWLIERCGMPRGYTDAAHGGGRAGLSSRHTLALVNRGGASAADVASFARHVRDRVRAACGVTLRPEPLFVGFGVSPGELPDPG